MVSNAWTHNIIVSSEDIDYLTSLLLERETPLSTHDLALALIEKKLADEKAMLSVRYQDTVPYNPSQHYESGQKLVFPAMQYSMATVVDVRPGYNPQIGDFNVIQVEFAEGGAQREFAADLTVPHKLSVIQEGELTLPGMTELSAAEILEANYEDITLEVEAKLVDTPGLIYVGQKWFPRDLMIDVNEGHLNLAEAVLDIAGGGPMTTEGLLAEIGGLGDGALELQAFSMNFALDQDRRFDEVGPAGEVLWYLARLEPDEVKQVPANLQYTPLEVDRSLMTPDMLALESEIADELTEIEGPDDVDEATIILIYPHRRNGTLPLNAFSQKVFPTARRAPRIFVTLVDGQDGEEYIGWVAHREGYVYGLAPFYRKHKLPVGGFVTVRRSEEPGKIIVNFNAYRPRSEYVPLMSLKNDQIQFENIKRPIGADYDDQMVIGVDDLTSIEAYAQTIQQQRKSVTSIIKLLLPPLSSLTPQGTVHAKMLYSAFNALRRCPPGPILATLNANPDFENVGGHYWRLSAN